MPTKNKQTSRKVKTNSKQKKVRVYTSFFRSRPVQLIFMGVFAGIASVFLLKSFAAAPNVGIVCPFDGHPSISSGYGVSRPGHTHAGIDIPVPGNTPIYASQDGNLSAQIEDHSASGGYGHYVDLVNGTYRFRYGHLTRVARGAGAVKAGDLIAYSGNSGDSKAYHLHYEIHQPNTGGTAAYGTRTTIDPAPSYNACRQRGSNTTSPGGSSGGGTNNSSAGRIQGLKHGGDNVLSIERKGTGQRSFVNSKSDGSYSFDNLTIPATYIVRVNGASGQTISWTACAGKVGSCHNNPDARGTGTEAEVYLGSGYIDLWWDYSGSSSSAPPPSSSSSAKNIVGAASHRCLDAAGYGTANGTKIQLWDCLGGSNQKWTARSDYTIVNAGSGRCLDAAGYGSANGTSIQLWDCTGTSNQKWHIHSNGTICSFNGDRCLDASGYGTSNGTAIQLWDDLGGSNQHWSFQ